MSVFMNDPFEIVAEAFERRYPGVEYMAQIKPALSDRKGRAIYGETVLPDDGSPALVSISAAIPFQDMIEVFAHELAHVGCNSVYGEACDDHGVEWAETFEYLNEEYMRIAHERRLKKAGGQHDER